MLALRTKFLTRKNCSLCYLEAILYLLFFAETDYNSPEKCFSTPQCAKIFFSVFEERWVANDCGIFVMINHPLNCMRAVLIVKK